jgi:hypothetical protein
MVLDSLGGTHSSAVSKIRSEKCCTTASLLHYNWLFYCAGVVG